MNARITILSLMVLLAMVVAACGGPSASSNLPADEGSQAAAGADTAADDGAMAEDEDMATGDSIAEDGDMAEDEDMATDDSMAEDEDMATDDGMAEDGDMAEGDDSMAEDGDMAEGDDSMADDGDMAEDEDMATDDSMAEDADMAEGEAATMELPAWFHAELTDVNTGQTFSLAGLQGKVVLVETMAIWCPTCLRQQREVQALHEALGEREDLVTVTLDIDPNEDAASLKGYADQHGFGWVYAVAPRDVAREIGQLYGDQFLNPPSTPILIVDRHGAAHPLPFGVKTAADLEEALAPFLAEGM